MAYVAGVPNAMVVESIWDAESVDVLRRLDGRCTHAECKLGRGMHLMMHAQGFYATTARP